MKQQLVSKFDNLLQDARRAVSPLSFRTSKSVETLQAVQVEQQHDESSSSDSDSPLSSNWLPEEQNSQSHNQQQDAAEVLTSPVQHVTTEETTSANTVEANLQQQVEAMQAQLQQKQQEIKLLQAQVQRLSNYVDSSMTATGQTAHEAKALQEQLEQATTELSRSQSRLQVQADSIQQLQLQLAASEAAEFAFSRRCDALKILLAGQLEENLGLVYALELGQQALQEAQQGVEQLVTQRTAAQIEVMHQQEDYQAIRAALNAANSYIAQITEQQQQQQQQPDSSVEPPSADVAAFGVSQDADHIAGTSNQPQEQQQQQKQQQAVELQHKQVLVRQQQQQQQWDCAAQQLQELGKALAVKEESLAYTKRHMAFLEQQLAAAKQQLTKHEAERDAWAPPLSAVDLNMECSSPELYPNSRIARSSSTPMQAQQQQQHSTAVTIAKSAANGMQTGSTHVSSGRSPSIEGPESIIAADEASATKLRSCSATGLISASPKLGDQLASLSPFARVRDLIAQREADQLARLKEELKGKERQLHKLSGAAARSDSQLHGLQTVLAAKTGQCNRLEQELRQADKQLKQVQAAADAEGDDLRQQVARLSQQVLQLQGQLGAVQEREQQQHMELTAAQAKLTQLMAVTVQNTHLLWQQQTAEQQAWLARELEAVLADMSEAATVSTSASGVAASTVADSAASAIVLSAQTPVSVMQAITKSRARLASWLGSPVDNLLSSSTAGDDLPVGSTSIASNTTVAIVAAPAARYQPD